jgi:hypothetical protein
MTARFALDPPVRAGHAAFGVLPGAVNGVDGDVEGAAVVGADEGVADVVGRVGALGCAVVGAAVGAGEMLTGTSGVQASNVSKNSTLSRRDGLLICI